MEQVFRITRGSRPLNLTVDNSDRVLFGEYGGNPDRHEIFIFISEDGGRKFEVGYKFEPGEIRHVHNILCDPFLGGYWVLVGDYGNEPGIGWMPKDLSKIDWVVRGTQSVRAVGAIVERDYLFYGTDSEIEQNHIVRLDKKTGDLTFLREIEGSSLFASRFGEVKLISTDVEPSNVNRSRNATLYASRDASTWHLVGSYPKDVFQWHLFQYGTVVLPVSDYGISLGMFSGQAVKGLDGQVRIISFDPKRRP